MNKYFDVLLIILILFNSCGGQNAQPNEVENDTTTNLALPPSNLILDSSKLESFIEEQKSGDTAAVQLRRFYKPQL